jgi:DNA-directed RNA polymerase specialized sigma24 family protein
MHTDGLVPRQTQVDALEIEDAMVALAAVCNESAAVAELRLWGGLELEQIATALDMPFSRVRSRWNRAKAWLARELTESEARTSKGSVANDK